MYPDKRTDAYIHAMSLSASVHWSIEMRREIGHAPPLPFQKSRLHSALVKGTTLGNNTLATEMHRLV
jgi:hypothetical protein